MSFSWGRWMTLVACDTDTVNLHIELTVTCGTCDFFSLLTRWKWHILPALVTRSPCGSACGAFGSALRATSKQHGRVSKLHVA